MRRELRRASPQRIARRRGEGGFSLIETMLATMLLAGALIGTAQMMVVAVKANQNAQRSTYAATLAQEKMEQLRALLWGYDDIGLPVQDYGTNLANDPPTNDGVGLTAAPDNALSSNVLGYVDFIDRFGRTLGSGGGNAPEGTVYVRRWSVEPLPTNPNNTLILQVLVFNVKERADRGDGAVLDKLRDEARLVSVKTRKTR